MKLTVDIEKRIDNFLLQTAFEVGSERFALLGASGSGKSMTLKCIAGIEKPDRGRIVLGDRVLFDSEKKVNVPPRSRKVGYLFQDYALFPNMTVRQNVHCAASDKAYADSLIERFDIGSVAGQYPAELSGGQAQRVAIARMLAVRPEVLLFDEPFAALDNYIKNRMEHEILDMLDMFKGPAILVSHDRNEVYRLAARIGVMDNGSIVDLQDKKDFFDHPKTVASARLTGCKNISRLTVNGDGTAFADDWGVCLRPNESISFDGIRAVGYRAHYFELIRHDSVGSAPGTQKTEKTNAIDKTTNMVDCVLQRVIEDTFSVAVCFKQAGNESESPDALMTWVVNKNEWPEYEHEVMSGRFRLFIDVKRLMVFA